MAYLLKMGVPCLGVLAQMGVIAAAAAWYWSQHVRVYHLLEVQAGVLYRGGVRTVGEFARVVQRIRPRLVVSLVDDREMASAASPPFADVRKLLDHLEVRVERIPVALGGWPTTADLRRFIELVEDPSNQPALVHCAQGVRRTGMFVAAYQASILHYSRERLAEAIQRFGHSARMVSDVERFIRLYDAETRAVPDGFADGGGPAAKAESDMPNEKLTIDLPAPMPAAHDCLPHAAMNLGAGGGALLRPVQRMVRRLVIEPQLGGWVVYRLDEGGGFVGDTWHDSREDALEQVQREFGNVAGR